MGKEKNMNIMVNQYMKENILIIKDGKRKEKNTIVLVN